MPQATGWFIQNLALQFKQMVMKMVNGSVFPNDYYDYDYYIIIFALSCYLN